MIVPGFCTGTYGRSEDNISGTVVVTGGEVGTLTMIEGRNRLSLLRTEGGICPTTGVFRSSSDTLAVLGTTTRIRITLI